MSDRANVIAARDAAQAALATARQRAAEAHAEISAAISAGDTAAAQAAVERKSAAEVEATRHKELYDLAVEQERQEAAAEQRAEQEKRRREIAEQLKGLAATSNEQAEQAEIALGALKVALLASERNRVAFTQMVSSYEQISSELEGRGISKYPNNLPVAYPQVLIDLRGNSRLFDGICRELGIEGGTPVG